MRRAPVPRFATVLRKNGFDTSVFLVHGKRTLDRSFTGPSRVIRSACRIRRRCVGQDSRPQVDVVTWSQGGLVTRYWLKCASVARRMCAR